MDFKIKTASQKPPLDLIPYRTLTGMARVFQYGAKKYASGNYIRAVVDDGAIPRYMGAALRHMSAMQTLSGIFHENSIAALDEESGLYHFDHTLCGLTMLRGILIKERVMKLDPGEGREPPFARAA